MNGVPHAATDAFEEVVPCLFGRDGAVSSSDAIIDDVADLVALAGIEPEAVFVLGGVEFEVVCAVVEGDHRLSADGAVDLGIAAGVVDGAAPVVIVFGASGFEFVVGEPASVALGEVVDLDAVHAFFDERGSVSGAAHRGAFQWAGWVRCSMASVSQVVLPSDGR